MSDTQTYEHQETLPDQDEVAIQETVDSQALGVTHTSIPPVDSQPDQSKEVMDIYAERQDIARAARQLALVLENSGKTVSKVIQSSSQIIMRTILVRPGASEKLLSENFQRSVARLWLPIPETVMAVSNLQINSTFDLTASEIPASSVVIFGTAFGPYPYEFRTTDQLWGILEGDAASAIPVCVLEEFIS